MKLQVLVAAVNQDKYDLIKKMNIKSDAIIINQCNENKFEEILYERNIIKFLSFAERGVGLSRNNSLMRATADIILFADEDVTYNDGYKDIIISQFKRYPEADIIIFNMPSKNPKRESYKIIKHRRVRGYNCLRYGAVRIAARTKKIREANVYFSLLFGGGAKYSAGEDSLFLSDCIKKGLKVYCDPAIIGYVKQEDSSWFEGYTDKYFIDKGVFYAHLSKRYAKLLSLQFLIRHRKMFIQNRSIIDSYKLMCKGIKLLNDKDIMKK